MEKISGSLEFQAPWTDVVECISFGQFGESFIMPSFRKDKVRWMLKNLLEAEQGIHEFYRNLTTANRAQLFKSYSRCIHYCDEKLDYDFKKHGSFSQSPPRTPIFRTSRRKTPSPSFTSVEAQCATKTFVNIIKSYCEIRLKLIEDVYKQLTIILSDKRSKYSPVEQARLKETVNDVWKNQIVPLMKECDQVSDSCRKKLNLINNLQYEVFCIARMMEFDELITDLDFQKCVVCLGELDNRLDCWEKALAQTHYEGIANYNIFEWLQTHVQHMRSKMYLYFSDFLSDVVCKDKYFLNKINRLTQNEYVFFLLHEEEKAEEDFLNGFNYVAPCLQNEKEQEQLSSIEKFTILYSSTPSDKMEISKYELCTLAKEVHQSMDSVYKTFRFAPYGFYIMRVDLKTTAFLCMTEEHVPKMDDNFSEAFREFIFDLRLPLSFG